MDPMLLSATGDASEADASFPPPTPLFPTADVEGKPGRNRDIPATTVSRMAQLNIAGAGQGLKSTGGKKNFAASVRHSHTSYMQHAAPEGDWLAHGMREQAQRRPKARETDRERKRRERERE